MFKTKWEPTFLELRGSVLEFFNPQTQQKKGEVPLGAAIVDEFR